MNCLVTNYNYHFLLTDIYFFVFIIIKIINNGARRAIHIMSHYVILTIMGNIVLGCFLYVWKTCFSNFLDVLGFGSKSVIEKKFNFTI